MDWAAVQEQRYVLNENHYSQIAEHIPSRIQILRADAEVGGPPKGDPITNLQAPKLTCGGGAC